MLKLPLLCLPIALLFLIGVPSFKSEPGAPSVRPFSANLTESVFAAGGGGSTWTTASCSASKICGDLILKGPSPWADPRAFGAIASSDVTISKLTFLGPTSTDTYVSGETCIYASGPYGADFLRNIRLSDLEISNYGDGGIVLHRVAESFVSENRIRRIGHQGTGCLSCDNVIVSKNHISTVGPGPCDANGVCNAYGVYFSHLEQHPTSNNPASQSCIADSNLVENIPTWEGLDAHDGNLITFSNNIVKGCRIGIHAGGVYGGPEAMKNIVITGNNLSAGAASHNHYGIVVSGTPTHYATNVVVANNVVNGYGVLGDTESGAIQVQYSGPVSVTGNVIQDFAQAGIHFNVFNTNMLCSGNMISSGIPAGSAKAISVRDATTYGFIIGNRSNGFGLALPIVSNVKVGDNDF